MIMYKSQLKTLAGCSGWILNEGVHLPVANKRRNIVGLVEDMK